jgi:N-acetylglucosamine-6-phosphate deacetylase
VSGVARLEGRLLFSGASGGELAPGRLEFESGRITRLERVDLDGADKLPVIAPGLVDLHIHGFGGFDPLEDGGLAGMARALAAAGTTAFQPTLFPAEPAALGRDVEACWEAAGALASEGGCARVLGLHLEGPFVNPLAAGALPPVDLAEPSPAALAALLGPATGGGRGIRTMTLAPERAGARELIAELESAGIRASFGHSRATAAEARNALTRRDSVPFGVTHLYNAMTGLHHRDPGLASLALTHDTLVVELIGDLAHVGPEAIDLALRARGPAGLALVSDALAGAGTGCGVFHNRGREHHVHGGAAWYPATAELPERLAGSATGQLEAIRRLVAAGVVSLADALTMATLAPARGLGIEAECGQLRVGARADLIVLEAASLALTCVFVAGEALPVPAREPKGR